MKRKKKLAINFYEVAVPADPELQAVFATRLEAYLYKRDLSKKVEHLGKRMFIRPAPVYRYS